MTDLTLHDGKEITIDLYTFTNKEYMEIFEGDKQFEKADELIAKATGLTVKEFQELPYPDNRKIYRAFFKKCVDVITDPNSESVST